MSRGTGTFRNVVYLGVVVISPDISYGDTATLVVLLAVVEALQVVEYLEYCRAGHATTQTRQRDHIFRSPKCCLFHYVYICLVYSI